MPERPESMPHNEAAHRRVRLPLRRQHQRRGAMRVVAKALGKLPNVVVARTDKSLCSDAGQS